MNPVVKKSINEFNELFAIAQHYVENGSPRFDYAFKRNKEKLIQSEKVKEYNESIADKRVEYAATEKKDGKEILSMRNENAYNYSPENLIKLRKEILEAGEIETEFEPYYSTEIPKEIDDFDKEKLSGLFLNPDLTIYDR